MSKKNSTIKKHTKEKVEKSPEEIERDIKRNKIRAAIKLKWGTIKKYAEAKKIAETAMYERLQYLSDNSLVEFSQDGITIDNSLNQNIGKLNSGGEMTVTANDGKGLKAEEHNYYSDSGFKEAYRQLNERFSDLEKRHQEAQERIRELEEKLKRKK